MCDSYWTDLSNATTDQLMIQRKKGSHLGVEPDILISNYSIYEDGSNRESNNEAPLKLKDK